MSRVHDPGGRELWTWIWPLPRLEGLTNLAKVPSRQAQFAGETGDTIRLRCEDLTVGIRKQTGLLASVDRNGARFSLRKGPQLSAGAATLKSIATSTIGGDVLGTTTLDGDLRNVVWRLAIGLAPLRHLSARQGAVRPYSDIGMTNHTLLLAVTLAVGSLCGEFATAQSTPPFTTEEKEAVYTEAIARRSAAIVGLLNLNDAAKSNRLHSVIVAQYRALRARDEAMDQMFNALEKDAPDAATNRAAILPIVSGTLHDRFLAKLSAELTPEQVETVKDKMTYHKVEVTYKAYSEILPNLTSSDKAMILAALKEAREEAMDGGSADEKSAIFQKYKDQINARLRAKGFNVAKATREWEARQTDVARQTTPPSK